DYSRRVGDECQIGYVFIFLNWQLSDQFPVLCIVDRWRSTISPPEGNERAVLGNFHALGFFRDGRYSRKRFRVQNCVFFSFTSQDNSTAVSRILRIGNVFGLELDLVEQATGICVPHSSPLVRYSQYMRTIRAEACAGDRGPFQFAEDAA